MAADLRKRHSAGFDASNEGLLDSPGSMAGGGGGSGPWAGWSMGFGISIYLLSAILLWGGLGFLVDGWLGNERKVFAAIGMVVGAGAGIYLIYLRYGREHDEER
jgi:hypothetical protein